MLLVQVVGNSARAVLENHDAYNAMAHAPTPMGMDTPVKGKRIYC